jgi:hypothetical protein
MIGEYHAAGSGHSLTSAAAPAKLCRAMKSHTEHNPFPKRDFCSEFPKFLKRSVIHQGG